MYWVERGLTGLLGEAEKTTRGRMSSIAIATEDIDNILKERDFDVFVVTGWWDPLAAYSGSVEDDVNTNAIAAGAKACQQIQRHCEGVAHLFPPKACSSLARLDLLLKIPCRAHKKRILTKAHN